MSSSLSVVEKRNLANLPSFDHKTNRSLNYCRAISTVMSLNNCRASTSVMTRNCSLLFWPYLLLESKKRLSTSTTHTFNRQVHFSGSCLLNRDPLVKLHWCGRPLARSWSIKTLVLSGLTGKLVCLMSHKSIIGCNRSAKLDVLSRFVHTSRDDCLENTTSNRGGLPKILNYFPC